FARRAEGDDRRPPRSREEGGERRFERRTEGDDRRTARGRDEGTERRSARPVKSAWSDDRGGAAPRARRSTEEGGGSRKTASPVKPVGKPPRRTDDAETAPRRTPREEVDGDNTLRLSKRMSELGLCSRREADEWIEKGWVY
ncbi:hypothetical protein AB3X93_45025, partial [Paraburkholderia sp. BR14262]